MEKESFSQRMAKKAFESSAVQKSWRVHTLWTKVYAGMIYEGPVAVKEEVCVPMAETNKLRECMQVLAGQRLDGLHLACDMMMFSFGGYELHASCFTRIRVEERLLISSLDYQRRDGEAPEDNALRRLVEQNKERILGGVVTSVIVEATHDMKIILDNDIVIELFIVNAPESQGEEQEQWVFFRHRDPSWPFITVYDRSVDIALDWGAREGGLAEGPDS